MVEMLNIDELCASQEDEVRGVLDAACRNLRSDDVDNFRSYEDGVKDTVEWIFFGSPKPHLKNDDWRLVNSVLLNG